MDVNTELAKAIAAAVNGAAQLGVQAERVWPDMVGRFWLGQITTICGNLALFVVVSVLWYVIYKHGKVLVRFFDDSDIEPLGFSAMSLLIALTIVSVILLIGSVDSIKNLVYPEAGLIQSLLAK